MSMYIISWSLSLKMFNFEVQESWNSTFRTLETRWDAGGVVATGHSWPWPSAQSAACSCYSLLAGWIWFYVCCEYALKVKRL